MLASGIACLMAAIYGVGINSMVAYVMHTDKEMKNPTFTFMVHLALSDMEAFIGGMFYPSTIMISGTTNEPVAAVRLFSFFHDGGWHMSCCFLVLVAFSRFIFFCRPLLMGKIFSHRACVIMCASCWFVVHTTLSPLLWYTPTVLNHDNPDVRDFWWTPNNTVADTFIYIQIVHTGFTLASVVLFNTLSLYWLYKMRQSVMSTEIRANFKREIKLFVQCALDCLFFIFLWLWINIGHHLDVKMAWYWDIGDLLWVINHSDCALLYICFNTRLRRVIVDIIRRPFVKNNATVTVFPQNQTDAKNTDTTSGNLRGTRNL